MDFSAILKEAHARAKRQIAILKREGYKKAFTYRFILADKMSQIFHEIRTGCNDIFSFEKHLSYNP